MSDGTIMSADGRTIGYAQYGDADGIGVLWSHGGPGSRLEPKGFGDAASAAGLRLIGIDRPGYGLSTPQPGRTIGGWVSDALAVADHLRLDRFYTVGVSTGGAYALAVAAAAPDRVIGTVACCAMTDMSNEAARATMLAGALDLWNAPDRDGAIAAAIEQYGEDGSRMLSGPDDGEPIVLAPADMAMLADPENLEEWLASIPAQFAHGVEGYTDDRLADGPGWGTFDVGSVACPVTVLHGAADTLVDPMQALHTAALIPHAELRIVDDLGHLSAAAEVVPVIVDMQR
jgi:pimeloyl-ACP methyl ester carboxylesterase